METPVNNPTDGMQIHKARWSLVLAAVLWSLSGAFTRVITTDTSPVIGFSAHEPAMSPLAMAFLAGALGRPDHPAFCPALAGAV